MTHITTEQALQIPQQLQRQGSQGGTSNTANPPASSGEDGNKRLLADDAVTLMNIRSRQVGKKLQIGSFRSELGQDNHFVKETLKAKLSEYNLNPKTQIAVKKDMFGNIELKGAMLQSDIERISADLNNSKLFKEAFGRLSQQEPTLNYVDNVVKLSSAYGVANSLFNSLVSEESEFNKLNDIAHRYESLKATASVEGSELDSGETYQFVLNA